MNTDKWRFLRLCVEALAGNLFLADRQVGYTSTPETRLEEYELEVTLIYKEVFAGRLSVPEMWERLDTAQKRWADGVSPDPRRTGRIRS